MANARISDLLIIGGGINGAGIACDAAGRGLSVVLCEQGDLAGATSSASSKLIHGGLRYLENYEFRLVREALRERVIMLAKAPHIVRPLRFVLPHGPGSRPRWMIRAGLFLYDRMGGRRRLESSRALKLGGENEGAPPCAGVRPGLAYSDCQVDDARLVIFNARQAADQGAEILTRTRLIAAERTSTHWHARLEDTNTGTTRDVRARVLVNASGAWVQRVRDDLLGPAGTTDQPRRQIRLVRGSHIVVPRLYEGDHAYILQNPDGRVVFVIPFEDGFSLLGTTDIATDGDPDGAQPSKEEGDYIRASVNRYFAKPVTPAETVWSFAGLRALLDDGADNPSSVTRDYAIEIDGEQGAAPLLSLFGGKITTYRRLAEEVLAELRPFFPRMADDWTADTPLPGGEFSAGDFKGLLEDLYAAYPRLDPDWIAGLARRHGGLCPALLGDAWNTGDLGIYFGGGLYAREVDYLIAREWARTAEDILWRRTKLGLRIGRSGTHALEGYLGAFAEAG